MENQIKLLEKYGITDYTIKNGVITVNQIIDLDCKIIEKEFLSGVVVNNDVILNSLEKVHKDFLRGTIMNALWLNAVKKVPKGFLSETNIYTYLTFSSLEVAPEDFLKGINITGAVRMSSLKKAPKGLLEGTCAGVLYLTSLEKAKENFLKDVLLEALLIGGFWNFSRFGSDKKFKAPKGFLKNSVLLMSENLRALDGYDNFISEITSSKSFLRPFYGYNQDGINKPKELVVGYNKEQNYCFFDGILSRVLSVTEKKSYTIYTTPFEFIAQKGEFTAHGKTVKKAISDLEFKIISEKLKKDPINKNTEFTVKYYRALTGACDIGCRNWMAQNDIAFKVVGEDTVELKPIKAEELLPLLEKTNAYGIEKFKSLITF